MRRPGLLVLSALLAATVAAPCFGHYPFPCSSEEKAKSEEIKRAIDARTQTSVSTLTGLLEDKNPRAQAAALLGIMRLSNAPLDFTAAVTAATGLRASKHALVAGTADVAVILLDKKLTVKERRARLVKLTQSKEGRDRAAALRRGVCREGYQRRMAAEALRVVGDASVLPALEAMSDDNFGEHDDTFDMQGNARVAFETWWPIRSAGLGEEERLRVLIGVLRLGEPFGARWCDAACDRLEEAGERTVPLLMPVARGTEKRSKLWALRTLRHFRDSKEARDTVVEVCSRDIGSADRLVRHFAVYALGEVAGKSELPVLVDALAESRDPYVRGRAACALGRFDDEGAVASLKAALADPDAGVRTQAAAQLARKGLADGEGILLDALGAREGVAAYVAAGAMAHIKDHGRLAARIAELLQRQPGEEELDERPRILLNEMRNRMLRELARWDAEKLRPLAPTLRPALSQGRPSSWAQAVLKKLGD